MHQKLAKKIILIILNISLLCLMGCKKDNDYYNVCDYLKEIAIKTQIGNEEDYLEKLSDWDIYRKGEVELDSYLTYDYLKLLLNRFTDQIIINDHKDKYVNKGDGDYYLDKTIEIINNKTFDTCYEYQYKEGSKEEDNFYDRYERYKLSSSFNIDLNEAEIIPSFKNDTGQIDKYQLLSTNGFTVNGFRISYSILNGGLSIRVSKTDKNSLHGYVDVDLRNISPSFNWDWEDGEIKDAYLKVGFDSTTKIGLSIGKYLDYEIDTKNVNKDDFLSLIKSIIVEKNDVSFIPICTIKVPIPNVPLLYLNLEVGLHIYASGKIEVVVYNSSTVGFEIKNGNFRLIKDFENDIDASIGASFKSSIALNLSVSTIKLRLFDIELEGGVTGSIKTTIHLYDEDEEYLYETDEAYSSVDDLLIGEDEIAVCGDVSLRWLLNLNINTYRTLLYKLGFNKKIEFFDEDDQVFGNKHHIENGIFVDSCTRKNKTTYTTNKKDVDVKRIVLEKYSIVLSVGESYEICPISLPSGYTMSDLIFEADGIYLDMDNNLIKAIKSGSEKIKIYTDDLKYEIYLNVLVSYE